jgi:hypothetical protein
MFIHEQPNFIFIAVPKTASIAIHRMLESTFDKSVRHGTAEIFHTSAAQQKLEMGDDAWSSYYTFGVVRNPYARFYSLYRDFSSSIRQRRGEGISANSFASFCRNFGDSNLVNDIHFQPQHHFLCNNSKVCVDFVGKFESLEHDLEQIAKNLKIRFHPLPSVTVISAWTRYANDISLIRRCRAFLEESMHRKTGDNWIAHYSKDPDLQSIVQKHYKDDFEIFNYSADIKGSSIQ